MKKISVHRALAELKTVDARIEKGIRDSILIGIQQKGRHVILKGNLAGKEEDFVQNSQAEYDSILALIKNKETLKKAIVTSNAATSVKIGEATMTVADAITAKTYMQSKKDFLTHMVNQYREAVSFQQRNNDAVEKNKENLLIATFGKDQAKIDKDAIEAIVKPYLENNTFNLQNPLDLEKKIKDLDKEISAFETEVDAALSEINATTLIDVDI